MFGLIQVGAIPTCKPHIQPNIAACLLFIHLSDFFIQTLFASWKSAGTPPYVYFLFNLYMFNQVLMVHLYVLSSQIFSLDSWVGESTIYSSLFCTLIKKTFQAKNLFFLAFFIGFIPFLINDSGCLCFVCNIFGILIITLLVLN